MSLNKEKYIVPTNAIPVILSVEKEWNYDHQSELGSLYHNEFLMTRQYSHAIPIEHNLKPGALWEYKHTLEELKVLEKADVYNYSAQYLQDPHKKGGSVFESAWWQYYEIAPAYEYKAIFGDTALKDGEHNDYTVFQCWGKFQGKIYLIDQYRKKVKAADLKQEFLEFWGKHKGTITQPNRGAYIEDKASGIQLIQEIQKVGNIPVIAIPRDKSKVHRANNLTNWIKSGLLYLPKNADWLYDYKNEFERFSPLMTHKHDDQVDPTLDAIDNMLISDIEFVEDENQAENTTLAPDKNETIW